MVDGAPPQLLCIFAAHVPLVPEPHTSRLQILHTTKPPAQGAASHQLRVNVVYCSQEVQAGWPAWRAHPVSRTPYAYVDPEPTEKRFPRTRDPSLST